MAKVITVFGATGGQGGGVVDALLALGKFKVRAVTRSLESEKAKKIAAKGVEVVKASFDDLDSMKQAIKGSYGVFLVTNFWELLDGARETKQGKDAVDICIAEGVQHLIYSGLESAKKMYGFDVVHFDCKAVVEEYIESKAGSMKWNSVRVAFYFQNFFTFFKPAKQSDGSYALGVPMEGKKMYGIDVADVGACIASIFNEPDAYAGKIIPIAGDFLAVEEYAAVLSKILAPVVFKDPKQTCEQHANLGYPGAEELAAMFKLYQKGSFRDVPLTKKLNPKAKSFEEFAKANKEKFQSLL